MSVLISKSTPAFRFRDVLVFENRLVKRFEYVLVFRSMLVLRVVFISLCLLAGIVDARIHAHCTYDS